MKHKIITSTLLFIGLCSLTGCYFFPAEEELLDPPTVAVEEIAYSTYTAREKTIEDKTMATGYVWCKSEFNAGFPESGGTLKQIFVTPGQHVEKGDLLAELDTGNLSYLYEQQKLIVQKAQLTYNATGSADDRLTYEMEQNTLAEYERQLGNSRIYAGMSGEVCYIQSLKPGDTITAYKTIVKIVDPAELCIRYSAASMKSFPLGQEVTITIDGENYSGYVSKTPTDITAGLYDEYPAVLADTAALFCEFTDGLPGYLTVGQTADIEGQTDKCTNNYTLMCLGL